MLGTIEAVKTVADIFSPLSGEVIEINSEIENSPEIINLSPHEKGWMIKVESYNLDEVKKLLSKEEYMKII